MRKIPLGIPFVMPLRFVFVNFIELPSVVPLYSIVFIVIPPKYASAENPIAKSISKEILYKLS